MKNCELDGYINEFYNSVGDDAIHGHVTREVYDTYVNFCKNKNAPIIRGKIDFSRQIVKRFDYQVEDKKIKGTKFRIFIK